MRTPTELCSEANWALRDWRFEPLADGTLRLRQHPYGGLQPLSLLGAVVFIGLAATVRNRVYADANWLLIGMFSCFAAMLLVHGATTVAYLAGDNFLEQQRFFCGLPWRRRRLLGANLEAILLRGGQDRWRLRAVRKGVELGSLIFGSYQLQPIGELLARRTGWKLTLYLEDSADLKYVPEDWSVSLRQPFTPPPHSDPETPITATDSAADAEPAIPEEAESERDRQQGEDE